MNAERRLQEELVDKTESALARARHPSAMQVAAMHPRIVGAEIDELMEQMSEVIAEQAQHRARMAVLRRRRQALRRALLDQGVRLP